MKKSKRSGEATDARGTQLLRAGDVYLDLEKYEVIGIDKRLRIVGKQRILMKLFFERQGVVITNNLMYEALYGDDEALPHQSIFRVYVRYLRKQLEELSSTTRIETIHSVGYKLVVDIGSFRSNEKRPRE